MTPSVPSTVLTAAPYLVATPAAGPRPLPVAPIDLSTPKRLHVVGVGGPGMSAIAIVLAEMGHTVSGSDIRDKPITERLRAAGVAVKIGHHRGNVDGVDAVTASTAVPARNVELDQARVAGAQVLRRAGMLAGICAEAKSLAFLPYTNG